MAPYWYDRLRDGVDVARLLLPCDEAEDHPDPRTGRIRFPVVPPGLPASPRERDLPIVMVNARKRAPTRRGVDLYVVREEVAADLCGRGLLRIYGRGWDGSGPRWTPAGRWRGRRLARCAGGPVASKYAVLQRARFALAMENTSVPGYRSEKVFDAMYAGAVPIYLGDPTLPGDLPRETLIDYAALRGPGHLAEVVRGMSERELVERRAAMMAYLAGEQHREHRPEAFVDRLAGELRAVLRDG